MVANSFWEQMGIPGHLRRSVPDGCDGTDDGLDFGELRPDHSRGPSGFRIHWRRGHSRRSRCRLSHRGLDPPRVPSREPAVGDNCFTGRLRGVGQIPIPVFATAVGGGGSALSVRREQSDEFPPDLGGNLQFALLAADHGADRDRLHDHADYQLPIPNHCQEFLWRQQGGDGGFLWQL